MKIAGMIDWTEEERTAKEKEWTQALFNLRLQKATGQLENPMKIREVRKDLARLKTLVNMPAAEKEHAASHAAEAATEAAASGAATAAKPKGTVASKGKKTPVVAKPAQKGGARGASKAGKKAAAAAVAKGHSPSKKKAASAPSKGKAPAKPAKAAKSGSKKKSK